MQILQPLAVGNIRLPTRHVLHVARVDEAHLEPTRLENLKERDPEHPRRLHRHRAHATRLEPVCQRVEILGERLKLPDRSGIAVGVDRHVNTAGTNVDTRRISPNRSRALASGFPSGALGSHGASSWGTPASGPGRATVSLLNGIVRRLAARHH